MVNFRLRKDEDDLANREAGVDIHEEEMNEDLMKNHHKSLKNNRQCSRAMTALYHLRHNANCNVGPMLALTLTKAGS